MGKKGFLATRDRFTLCCFRTARIPIVVSQTKPADSVIVNLLGLPALDAIHRPDRVLWIFGSLPGLVASGISYSLLKWNPSKLAGILGGVEVLQVVNHMDCGLGGKG